MLVADSAKGRQVLGFKPEAAGKTAAEPQYLEHNIRPDWYWVKVLSCKNFYR